MVKVQSFVKQGIFTLLLVALCAGTSNAAVYTLNFWQDAERQQDPVLMATNPAIAGGNGIRLTTLLRNHRVQDGMLELHISSLDIALELLADLWTIKAERLLNEALITLHCADENVRWILVRSFNAITYVVDGPTEETVEQVAEVQFRYKVEALPAFNTWYEGRGAEEQVKIKEVIYDLRMSGASSNGKPCRDKVFEIKSPAGNGRRIYYFITDGTIWLLNGGDKLGGQDADINEAVDLVAAVEKEVKYRKKDKANKEKKAKKVQKKLNKRQG